MPRWDNAPMNERTTQRRRSDPMAPDFQLLGKASPHLSNRSKTRSTATIANRVMVSEVANGI
jgi:hypothetical protein